LRLELLEDVERAVRDPAVRRIRQALREKEDVRLVGTAGLSPRRREVLGRVATSHRAQAQVRRAMALARNSLTPRRPLIRLLVSGERRSAQSASVYEPTSRLRIAKPLLPMSACARRGVNVWGCPASTRSLERAR